MADPLLFRWQGVSADGQLRRGAFFCFNRQEAMAQLVAQDFLPLKLSAGRRYRARDWKWQDKITLFRQLATLLKAGMTLSASLQLTGEGHSEPGWQALLGHIQQRVTEGSPFSQALAEWPTVFPALFPALMQVGELTGQMDECCLQLASQQERQQQLQKKVVKALRYPLFVLAIALLVSTCMLLFVLPEFVAIYQTFDAPLPLFTAAVISLSQGMQQYGPILLAVPFAAFCGWRWQARRSPGWQRWQQRTLLRLPFIGELFRGSQLSRIFMTLALTQQSGLTLLRSLQAVEKTLSQKLWQEAIADLQQHISGGYPLHQALAGHLLFTSLSFQLIKVGEEAGSLDSMLSRLGDYYENTTHERADNLAAALEPLMMVVTGGIVGTLVIAMYLPVFGLGEALG